MINSVLNETVRSIRQKNLKKAKSRKKASYWREKDLLKGEVVDVGVLILPTCGCSWGRASGCTMCGYVYESGKLGDKELGRIFREALVELGRVPYLKIFTSGSFFDRREVSEQLLTSMIDTVNDMNFEQIQVESRPEFIKKEGLKFVKENLDSQLEIGIGLETSSDLIRANCINKGFSFSDYKKAVKLSRSLGIMVKTYLLLKPPFILEREAVIDTVGSARDAATAGSSRVSINPMNIQRGTLVELLWKRKEYRPPWLWSLVEVLERLTKDSFSATLLSHPTGGGSKRGAHNCGKCDVRVMAAIREFSTTQDPTLLESLECRCKKHWKDYLSLE
jgi:radical SAM enzyme (TIGR01210 family)